MRRGCMSVGDIHCDNCGRIIKHPEQYLAMDVNDTLARDDIMEKLESDKPERHRELKSGRGPLRYCTNCSMSKGYAKQRADKGDKGITFFEK